MNTSTFDIVGPLLFEGSTFKDHRGFFVERFKKSFFDQHLPNVTFVQDNFSHSLPGVLRGIHFQHTPAQGKLVTCLSGSIFDIAVDLRKASPTFGKFIAVYLSGKEPKWLWIPPGFGHGFSVVGNEPADVFYKVDAEYNASGESGILWNDHDLNIPWPVSKPITTEKDQGLMSFKSYKKAPVF